MLIKTILNKCHKFKSFVYGNARFAENEGKTVIEIDVKPRKNSKTICSGCQKPAPGYDSLEERKFEFIPIWGFLVFFVYTMRRVQCHRCGVRVEEVPWAEGKRHQTKTYMQFLAHWAKKLSWKEWSATCGSLLDPKNARALLSASARRSPRAASTTQ